MFDRMHRKTAAATAAVLAALGLGGGALAASAATSTTAPPAKAQSQTPPPASEVPGQESSAPENSATDPDNVQQGDQTAADPAGGAPDTADAPGANGAEQESGSEVVNDDGPGGHADEPANPAADTQQQGVR
jgi:hypothetical protein